MKKILKIANTQAFWGDRSTATAEILDQVEDLDVLTLDYLAEVSMSILAIQKEKDPSLGYAMDFLDVIQSLIPYWKKKRKFKLICNAGGLNPDGCAEACARILKENDCNGLKIGIVSGDNVLSILNTANDTDYVNMDTNAAIGSVKNQLVTANAYLGSQPIVGALKLNADIVITGRVADPCLVAAACIDHFNWNFDDYDKIAGAIIAGHLIECGTQVTGGCSTHWLEYSKMDQIGYPIVEVNEDGFFVITKSTQSGGKVSFETVKEQLLYEIGNPACYLCPDATVSFLELKLSQDGIDRIKITGAKGSPPPKKYKVSATYRDGYRIETIISLFGRKCREKGLKCGEIILKRLISRGYNPKEYIVECLGTGDIVPTMQKNETIETVIRIAAKDYQKEPLEELAKEIAPLVTSGPQGITGYTSGRAKVRPIFSFWPTLIEKTFVKEKIKIIEV